MPLNPAFLIGTSIETEPSWNPLHMKLDDAHNREISSNLRHLMIIPHILYIYICIYLSSHHFFEIFWWSPLSRRVGWSSVPLCVLTFVGTIRWRRRATKWLATKLGIYWNEPPQLRVRPTGNKPFIAQKKGSCNHQFSGTTFVFYFFGSVINQWLFLVPLKGGRWHSPSPNWQEKYHLYTIYSPCRTWGVKYATDPTF